MNLFDIDIRIEQIAQAAYDAESGEILDEQMLEELDKLELEKDKKIENTALFIKGKRALASAISGEIKALQMRKKVAERMADNAEKYLEVYMGGEKFSTPRVSVSWKTTQAVNVTDLAKVPKEYLRYKDPEVNKTAVSKLLKAGKTVEGCELETHTSIVLK